MRTKNAWSQTCGSFKTGPGEYGEHDQFVGLRVPDIRKIAKKYKDTELAEVKKLFLSPYHEHRLCAALILTYKPIDANVYDFYLNILKNHTTSQTPPDYAVSQKERSGIDGWDIVDSSAHKIVGRHLAVKPRDILYELADSSELWQNRVAMIATAWFIGKLGQCEDALRLAEIFVPHKHDLMHKASGWMLREVGKQDKQLLIEFLEQHAQNMPRTMLSYSMEKLSTSEKEALSGKNRIVHEQYFRFS